jgi:biopolymer transport protein ExbD
MLCTQLSAVSAAQKPTGVHVYLPRACNDRDGFSNRTIVLHVLSNGDTEINLTPFSRTSLGPRMAEIFATRQEKVLRVVADDNAIYQDVLAAIDNVKMSVPRLVILLVDGSAPNAATAACISSSEIRPEDL